MITFPSVPKKTRSVYLDHAATTPIDPAVLRAMRPYLAERFANPSPLYSEATSARRAIDDARTSVARVLGTQSDAIIFAASGTESINLAIFGVARAYEKKYKKPGHIISSTIEHHAVLEPINALVREGWHVTYVPVDASGRIDPLAVVAAFRPDTVLVSIMYANNEIGTIEPIAEIGKELMKWRKKNATVYPYFHTDACQGAAYLDLTVDRLHVDLMSVNGSKVYGPKGIAFLYKRRSVNIEPIIYGGGQEFGMRSGTENVAGIVGLGRALELAQQKREKETARVEKLRNYLWREIEKSVPNVVLNGPIVGRTSASGRLPNNLSVTFSGIDAEALILYLDTYGIACSSGSACATHNDETSHVLQAVGVSAAEARSTVRFTLGNHTTKSDLTYVLRYLPKIVRSISTMNQYANEYADE